VKPARCSICGGALEPHLAEVRDPHSGEVFAIERCAHCGAGFTTPVPDDLGRYYGPAYWGGRHGFTKIWCMRRRMRLLARATRGVQPRERGVRLLDVGCGDGAFISLARRAGWQTTGTEFGDNAARLAREGLPVVEGLEAAAARGPFDAITIWHALEHMPDPRRALEDARALLGPHGVVIVAVPDAGGLQANAFRKHWFHLDVPRHLVHFDARSLAYLIDTAGLMLTGTSHLEAELDVFGWIQSALNAALPTQNGVFDALTGKARRGGRAELAAGFLGAAALGPAAIAATAASALTHRGATIVAFARSR